MKEIIKVNKYAASNNLNKKLKDSVSYFCGFLNSKIDVSIFFTNINKDNSPRIARKLNTAIKKFLKPLPNYDISVVDLDEFDAVRVDMTGEELPYSCDDKYYIVKDNELKIMSVEELGLFMNLYQDSSPYWKQITRYDISYLDEESFKKYYEKVYNTTTDIYQNLKDLGLIIDDKLTYACFYLFSQTKLITIKINDYINNTYVSYHDNVFNLLNNFSNYIRDNNLNDIYFDVLCNNLLSSDFNEYIVINININNDDISIENDTYIKDQNNIKNKFISNILDAYYNFKTDKEISSYLKDNSLDYQETTINNVFKEKISFAKKVNIDKEAFIEDKATIKVKDKFIELLIRNPYMTNNEMASILKTSTKTIQRKIKELKQKGIISREGNYRNGYWKIDISKLEQ